MDTSPTRQDSCKMFDTNQDDVIYLDLDSGTPCRVNKHKTSDSNNNNLCKTIDQNNNQHGKGMTDMNNTSPLIDSDKEFHSPVKSYSVNPEPSVHSGHDKSVLPPIESFIPCKPTWLFSGQASFTSNGNIHMGDSNYSDSVSYIGDNRSFMYDTLADRIDTPPSATQGNHHEDLPGSFAPMGTEYDGLNSYKDVEDGNLVRISSPDQHTVDDEFTYALNETFKDCSESVGKYSCNSNQQMTESPNDQVHTTIKGNIESSKTSKKCTSVDTSMTNVLDQTPTQISIDESCTEVLEKSKGQRDCTTESDNVENVPTCAVDDNCLITDVELPDTLTKQTQDHLRYQEQSVDAPMISVPMSAIPSDASKNQPGHQGETEATLKDPFVKGMATGNDVKTKSSSCLIELLLSDESTTQKSTESKAPQSQARREKPSLGKTSVKTIKRIVMNKTQRRKRKSTIASSSFNTHTTDSFPHTNSELQHSGSNTEHVSSLAQVPPLAATYPLSVPPPLGYQPLCSPLSIKIPNYSQGCPLLSRETPLSLRQYEMRQPILYPHRYPDVLRPRLYGTSGGYISEENNRNIPASLSTKSLPNPFVSEASPLLNIPRPRFFQETVPRFTRSYPMYAPYQMQPTGQNGAFPMLTPQPNNVQQSFNGRYESPLFPSPSFFPRTPVYSPYGTPIGGARTDREYSLRYGMPNPSAVDRLPSYKPPFIPGMWSPVSSLVDDHIPTPPNRNDKHASASKVKGARTRNRNRTYGIKNAKMLMKAIKKEPSYEIGPYGSLKGVSNLTSQKYLYSTENGTCAQYSDISPSILSPDNVPKKGSLLRDLLETPGSSPIENIDSYDETQRDLHQKTPSFEVFKKRNVSKTLESQDIDKKVSEIQTDITDSSVCIVDQLKSGTNSWHPCIGLDNDNTEIHKSEKTPNIGISDVVLKTQQYCPNSPIETSMKDHDDVIGVDSDMDNSEIIVIEERKCLKDDELNHNKKGLSVKDLVDLCTEEYTRDYLESHTNTITTAHGSTSTITTHSKSSGQTKQNDNSVPIFRPFDSPVRSSEGSFTRPNCMTTKSLDRGVGVLDPAGFTYTPRFLSFNVCPQPSVYDGAILPVVYGDLPKHHATPRMSFGHFPPLSQSTPLAHTGPPRSHPGTPLSNIYRGNISSNAEKLQQVYSYPDLDTPYLNQLSRNTAQKSPIQNHLDCDVSPIEINLEPNPVSHKKRKKRHISKRPKTISPAPTKEMMELSSETINSLLRKRIRQKKKEKVVNVNGPNHKDHVFIKPKTTNVAPLPTFRPVLFMGNPPCSPALTRCSQSSMVPQIQQTKSMPALTRPIINVPAISQTTNNLSVPPHPPRMPILRSNLPVFPQYPGLPIFSQTPCMPMMSPIITTPMLSRTTSMPEVTQTSSLPFFSQMPDMPMLSTTPNMSMASNMPMIPMIPQVSQTATNIPFLPRYSNTQQVLLTQQQPNGQYLTHQLLANSISEGKTSTTALVSSQIPVCTPVTRATDLQFHPQRKQSHLANMTGADSIINLKQVQTESHSALDLTNSSFINNEWIGKDSLNTHDDPISQENGVKTQHNMSMQNAVSVIVGTTDTPSQKTFEGPRPHDSHNNPKNVVVQIEDTETGSLYELVDSNLENGNGCTDDPSELPRFTQICAGTAAQATGKIEDTVVGSGEQSKPVSEINVNSEYDVPGPSNEPQVIDATELYSTSGRTNHETQYASSFGENKLMLSSQNDSVPVLSNNDFQMAPLFENRDVMPYPVFPSPFNVPEDTSKLLNTPSSSFAQHSLNESFTQPVLNTPNREDSLLWQPWGLQNLHQQTINHTPGACGYFSAGTSEPKSTRSRKKKTAQGGDILSKLTRDLGIAPGPEKKTTPTKAQDSCPGSKKKHHNNRPLPHDAHEILNQWFTTHILNPYPSKEEKIMLGEACGLSITQINSWFVNKRNRTNNTRPVRHKAYVYDKINSVKTRLAKELEANGGKFENVDLYNQRKIVEDVTETVSLVQNFISVAETSFPDQKFSICTPLSPIKDVFSEKKDLI
ncbi:unnamed protein product [Owenia fusiformis]|uniref:Uncharacterized protein n=1 Tax=Owenia fusiformis TaxID=6347 RepID=A0A8J1TC99_OWEFU|nr:unnamed protein product [Owenia fusiformis]